MSWFEVGVSILVWPTGPPSDADVLWDGAFAELYQLRKQPAMLRSFVNQVDFPLKL
ncbi:MAG: hypothetical protein ACFCD0_25080 [Gemmataceae bacterium]